MKRLGNSDFFKLCTWVNQRRVDLDTKNLAEAVAYVNKHCSWLVAENLAVGGSTMRQVAKSIGIEFSTHRNNGGSPKKESFRANRQRTLARILLPIADHVGYDNAGDVQALKMIKCPKAMEKYFSNWESSNQGAGNE